MLQELFAFAGAFLLVLLVGTAVAWGLTLHALRRANRVCPGRRSRAPLSWLWSWREPARLHRRLRRAVQSSSTSVIAVTPTLRSLADEVAERAAILDDELAATSRIHWAWRGRVMAGLTDAVREVERSAFRLNRLAAEWRTRIHQLALNESVPDLDLVSRMDAVEAALAEVTAASRHYRSAP